MCFFPAFFWQPLHDQVAHVADRGKRQDRLVALIEDLKRRRQWSRPVGALCHQWRRARLSTVTVMPRGGRGGSPALHLGQGIPTPQSQASERALAPFSGRSPWSSQTQPVSSQSLQVADIEHCPARSQPGLAA
jgi:hypothetical protein